MSERRYLAGRPPDPARADEIYVSARTAEENDLQVGSTLRVRIATKREAGKIAETSGPIPRADPETTGTGPLMTLRVVGVARRSIRRTRSSDRDVAGFYEHRGQGWGTGLSSPASGSGAGTGTWTRSGPGSSGSPGESRSDLSVLGLHHEAPELDQSPGPGSPGSSPHWVGSPSLVLVAQALARQAALESERSSAPAVARDDARATLRLGMRRVVPVSLVAGVIAFGIAVALSPLAPLGVARGAEPDPGFALDAPLVAGRSSDGRDSWCWRPVSRLGGRRGHGRMTLGRGPRPPSGSWRAPASPPGRGWRSHGARAGAGPDRSARGVDAGRRRGRGRRGGRRIHDHREHGSPPLHASALRAELGRGRSEGHRVEQSPRVVRPPAGGSSIARASGGTVEETRVAGEPTGVVAMRSDPGLALAHAARGPGAGRGRARYWSGTKTADAIGGRGGRPVEGRIGERATASTWSGRGVLPELGTAGLARWPAARRGHDLQGHEAARPAAEQRNCCSWRWPPARTGKPRWPGWSVMPPPSRRERPADVGNWGRVSGLPHLLAALIAVGGGRHARPRPRHFHPPPATRPGDLQDAGLRAPRPAGDGRMAGDDRGRRRTAGRAAAGGAAGPIRVEPPRHRSGRRPRGRWHLCGRDCSSSRPRSCSRTSWRSCRAGPPPRTQPAAVLRAE